MAKASVLTIRVPQDLKHRISSLAKQQGMSINQMALYMFAKEIGHMESGEQLAKYWQGYSREEIENGFDEVMAKVKSRPVPDTDKL